MDTSGFRLSACLLFHLSSFIHWLAPGWAFWGIIDGGSYGAVLVADGDTLVTGKRGGPQIMTVLSSQTKAHPGVEKINQN